MNQKVGRHIQRVTGREDVNRFRPHSRGPWMPILCTYFVGKANTDFKPTNDLIMILL